MFYDRQEAGQELARELTRYRSKNAVVYGLPRGGVVVAAAVAEALHLPLEIIVTRKLTHPYNPEYAIGATAEHIEPIYNNAEIRTIDPRWLEHELAEQTSELRRRQAKYAGRHRPVSVRGRTGIIVDDGLATGLTMMAAVAELREQDPARIIVAVPVAPADTAEALAETADEVVVLKKPRHFLGGVGSYYEHFDQTGDQEVLSLLRAAWQQPD
jgi:putative phosphoribosyl transferase